MLRRIILNNRIANSCPPSVFLKLLPPCPMPHVPGGARGARRRQEAPGCARRREEAPGAPGRAKRRQDAQGSARIHCEVTTVCKQMRRRMRRPDTAHPTSPSSFPASPLLLLILPGRTICPQAKIELFSEQNFVLTHLEKCMQAQ